MDTRTLYAFIVGLIVWASQTKITFVLFGHLFVIPVLVLVATILVLLLTVLIGFIVRELASGRVSLGRA